MTTDIIELSKQAAEVLDIEPIEPYLPSEIEREMKE